MRTVGSTDLQQPSAGMADTAESQKVVIVGGGLVGSLAACMFSQRGYRVDLFEYRNDPRLSAVSQGRSINLAMSRRARAALGLVGLEGELLRHGIAMKARMIHDLEGGTREIPYDARTNQCIYSVGRKFLNDVLLSAAEKRSNVRLLFGHKMTGGSLDEGRVEFERTEGGTGGPKAKVKAVEAVGDLVVGCDGAFSSLRRLFMKKPMFNFSQTYIEHGYMELRIPPTADGEFAMPPNFLHIWPRGEFMMIALPNQDRSWTVTLFMPFAQFEAITTEAELLAFFGQHFADAVPLLGEDALVGDFFRSKPQPLVSVKCRPYHAGRALLLGDAAHAMVPFYGQGMNAGFEDVRLLSGLLDGLGGSPAGLADVLRRFSEHRNADAEAICDLAMYNYVEMRDLVNRPSFLLRKALDNALYAVLPDVWVPLYNSVTFSDMRYSECVRNRVWQDQVIRGVLVALLACAALLGLVAFVKA
ncbi:kynurenine 3-monooxygenase [Thrips palmi]|uniref:Kynurenine 3-monooxygenase n=1 Tax=Thrips palmi TaxID=161013 RepID=A0A6P9A9I0_THRPL|nr:kynurenine 3-monooxygenase [Thrips palmi]